MGLVTGQLCIACDLLEIAKLVSLYAGPMLGPFMRPSRLAKAMQDVFGPAAPPTEAFLANAYAALSFNGGNLILHECALLLA